jgi:hypothetical protein
VSLKRWLLDNFRRAVGTQAIYDRLVDMAPWAGPAMLTAEQKILLPGTPYARHLMPLDYLPSRDLRPRWGYGRPSHEGLARLFSRDKANYLSAVAEMRRMLPLLSVIERDFSPQATSKPGWLGGAMTALDLAILYYFVAHYRPATYLEIGSGVTTCFARRAISDQGGKTRVVSIDPEPRTQIDAICDEVVRDGLETADLKVFADLQPGDIVFMDGSHRSFMNSDVTVFMLDVLPLLKPGVIVHVHDVLLPEDYPETFRHWYWNEQYLLAVYLLASAERVKILMPSHYLTLDPELRCCLTPPLVPLKGCEKSFLSGGSLWFTHVPCPQR